VNGPTKALIVAAGLGSRLGGAATEAKPLVPVAGRPLLHHTLISLHAVGVRRVVVVVGHRAEDIVSSLNELASSGNGIGITIDYVFSDRYRTTNNVYSLWLARDQLDEDVYLLDGDVLAEADLLRALDLPGDSAAAVVPYQPGMTGTVAQVNEQKRVCRLSDVRDGEPHFPAPHKTCSVYLLRADFLQAEFVPGLGRFVSEGRVNDFYEAVLAEIIARRRQHLRAVDCGHFRWCEVDDTNDWDTAEFLFADHDRRFSILAHAHGDFQRPGVVDHLVMTNIYFPPQTLRRDLQREVGRAMIDYPPGQAALARLMAGIVDEPPSRLVVANGASELIKIICGPVARRALVAVPGFNEYEQALAPGQLVRFQLGPPTFELDADAFYRAADEADVELAVVCSPNNPTSLVVPRDQLLVLCEKLARRGTRLLVDESFVDFCADPGSQSLRTVAGAHPNLALVKSLSMSCGMPGLRLGYLLTADTRLADEVRSRLPIWNVNGLAAAFLRLLPRYRRMLEETCRRVGGECRELGSLLREIPGVEVPAPSASFCYVRLPPGTDATTVARRLFTRHGLLVKDCSGKSLPDTRGYLRIKSRTPAENRRLAAALEAALATGREGHDQPAEQAKAR
jgi:histidinol-phosphate/aromatic aminotransferase/cobyric acid decarboxylase-like protein